MKPNGFMTVQEAAALLGCGKSTLYRLIQAGRLHAVCPRGLTRGWRITEEELARFVAEEFAEVSRTWL